MARNLLCVLISSVDDSCLAVVRVHEAPSISIWRANVSDIGKVLWLKNVSGSVHSAIAWFIARKIPLQ